MKLQIGKRYKAIGDCGMTKDKDVEGVLIEPAFPQSYVLRTDKGTIHSINENTALEVKDKFASFDGTNQNFSEL